MKYSEYLKSPHWQETRRKRLDKDGDACVLCGSKENLNVHHRNYRNVGKEDVENDLVTLCTECHTFVHENKDAIVAGIIYAQVVIKYGERGISKSTLRKYFGDHMKRLCIPIPNKDGVAVVPWCESTHTEDDLKREAIKAGLDYGKIKAVAKKLYYIALEEGGYLDDITGGEAWL